MASGDTLAIFGPLDGEPPTTAYATLDTITAATGVRPVLDFDGATDETIIFSSVMPSNYAGTTGVTVVAWAATSAGNTANVAFEMAFERVADGGNLAAGGSDFAADNTTGAVAGAGENILFDLTCTFTNGPDMDSVVAGDVYRLKVTRDTGVATNNDDLQLLAVEVRET